MRWARIIGLTAALGAGFAGGCARDVWMQRVSWAGTVGEQGGFEAGVVRNEHGRAESLWVSVPDTSWSVEWGATHELERTTLVEATVRHVTGGASQPAVRRERLDLHDRAVHVELRVRVLVDGEPDGEAVVRFDAPR